MRELLSHLEANDEEEDHHEAGVDPVVQVHVQSEPADIEPDLDIPQPEIGLGEWRVRPEQGERCDNDQEHSRTRLRANRSPTIAPFHLPTRHAGSILASALRRGGWVMRIARRR